MKYDSTHFIAILLFYGNKEFLIFKVLHVVVDYFLDKYVCIDYFSTQKRRNLIFHTDDFKTLFLENFQELAFLKFC